MTPRRLATWCLAAACLLAARLPAPAQTKSAALPVVKVRIYGSILPGYSRSDAKAFSEPMMKLIGRNLGLAPELEIADGTTPDDLFAFGKKLQDGEYHLGAIWGAEYGWLREKYPGLKPNSVATVSSSDLPDHTLLMVHKNSRCKTVADLKGKRLAVSKDMPLMDRVSLQAIIRDAKLEPKGFFVRGESLGNVRLAAAAVRNGKADCVAMATSIYFRLKELQPTLASDLIELKSGPVYPAVALVGSPEVLERIRKKLWDDLQGQFLTIQNSPEGKDCINYWRLQTFVAPDQAYKDKVDATSRRFPVEVLLNLD
jgi:ABC-type phosphate/phosphonate transport system substrate-binding protein